MPEAARRVSVDEARAFWAHPSQLEPGITPDMIHDDGVQFWACCHICLGFRYGPWPGVFMVDFGAKPAGWGRLVQPARATLIAFWADVSPTLIVGWTDQRKRAALAFAGRVGFRRTGEHSLADGTHIITQEWRPQCP